MEQPTDYDRLETLTAEQLEAKPKLFRILCAGAFKRHGFYSFTAIFENGGSEKVLVLPATN